MLGGVFGSLLRLIAKVPLKLRGQLSGILDL
jgi:hypothetical protein